VVLVNRGFVPADKRDAALWSASTRGSETVTGLLRLSEPHGGFLQSNDPAADRWFSRDVAAIARSRGLAATAPYFIDAEPAPGRSGLPVPGLTVLAFANNHLVYAITWSVLALMAAAAAVFLNVESVRSSRSRRAATAGPAG
jgi:surfeit locus 1 family protein